MLVEGSVVVLYLGDDSSGFSPSINSASNDLYGVHLQTKINDKKMIFDFQKQDNRRRNHNKRSRDSSI